MNLCAFVKEKIRLLCRPVKANQSAGIEFNQEMIFVLIHCRNKKL